MISTKFRRAVAIALGIVIGIFLFVAVMALIGRLGATTFY